MPMWYKHYAKDWLTSEHVTCMTLEQKGMFITLLDYAWVNDGLPTDENMLARLCGCDDITFNNCWDIVKKRFELKKGRLKNKRQEVEKKAYNDKVSACAKAGKLSALAKKKASQQKVNGRSTPVQRTFNDTEGEAEPEPYSKSNKKFSHTEIDNIYKAYPRHTAPVAAKKAIEKALLKSGLNYDTMMERVKKFAQSKKGRGEFCPHPATWFNQGRYDDDPAEWDKEYKKDGYMSDDEITRANIEKVKYNPRG